MIVSRDTSDTFYLNNDYFFSILIFILTNKIEEKMATLHHKMVIAKRYLSYFILAEFSGFSPLYLQDEEKIQCVNHLRVTLDWTHIISIPNTLRCLCNCLRCPSGWSCLQICEVRLESIQNTYTGHHFKLMGAADNRGNQKLPLKYHIMTILVLCFLGKVATSTSNPETSPPNNIEIGWLSLI